VSSQPEELTVTDFKAHCLEVVRTVHDKHKPYITTKRGKPLVRVVAVEEEDTPIFGCMAGTGTATDELFSTDEIWDADS
jgi:prevent-host-death family protein